MKTKVLILAILSSIDVSSFVYGQNNNDKKNNDKDNDKNNNKKQTTSLIIEKLSADVNLTDSQKIAIESRLLLLFTQAEDADKKTNKKESIEQKIAANASYEQFMDSILTQSQKQIFDTKIKSKNTK